MKTYFMGLGYIMKPSNIPQSNSPKHRTLHSQLPLILLQPQENLVYKCPVFLKTRHPCCVQVYVHKENKQD